ncbi:MAG: ABC transporter ATP-binding protein [Planctomycetaceae bacterium]|nr:ABC transporter ATP-binding protein [Planctomycetaceae bacterium]
MTCPAILGENIAYRYGTQDALRGVNLQLSSGGWLGLLGPNGSGKTTLFRLLSTLIPVQRGTIQVLGHDVSTAAAAVRSHLGVTFQSAALDVRLTVRENLKCGGILFGLTGRTLRQRINDVLEQFTLTDRQHSLVGDLSGGLKRRVELAKCLLHRPRILLLDEPTNGLDPRARQEFWETIRQDREQRGTTIVVATHLMHEAELCDQLLLMDRGLVVGQGSPAELQASLDGERLTIRCRAPQQLQQPLQALLECDLVAAGAALIGRPQNAAARIAAVVAQFREEILSIELARPSLEDVFLERTGRTLDSPDPSDPEGSGDEDTAANVPEAVRGGA